MNTTIESTALPDLQPLFVEALHALMDLARTTDKDHIKLRALLEIARLCRPTPTPAEPKPSLRSPRRSGGSSSPSPLGGEGRGEGRAPGAVV